MTLHTTDPSHLTLGTTALTLFWLCASLAAAQAPASDDASRAVARQLGAEGIDAYQAQQFAAADEKLERAYRLFAAPTLGLWSARARVKLGRWVEAAERYREAKRMPAELGNSAPQVQAQAEASRELDALVPRIPQLTVTLEHAEAAEVEVTLDGAPYPRDLLGVSRTTNPGEHKLLASRGSERIELVVQLAAQQHRVVPLEFQAKVAAPAVAAVVAAPQPAPAPEPPSPPPAAEQPPIQPASPSAPPAATEPSDVWTPVGIAALSVGGAALVTWGVSSLIANGKLEDCPVMNGKHVCSDEDQADAYDTAKTISTVSFWTGAVLAVGGVGALLLGAREPEHDSQAVSLRVGPTGVAVRGAF
ncbi:MAG TPA: hypothetical protein VJR89_09845 [Polyangiales bacterium]|nr:hypothetical protein [Polyangiales bacterium]